LASSSASKPQRVERDLTGLMIAPMTRSSRNCPLRHDAAAAAFPAAQAFDELGHWGARLDPKANEITLGDDAAVLTGHCTTITQCGLFDKDLPLIQVKDGNVSFCF
jgi:hypothetical protein